MNLRPRKLGSFEEYAIALSERLVAGGGESVLVFSEPPPARIMPAYERAGAVVEHKEFRNRDWRSATTLLQLVRRHRPDVVHFHFVNMLSADVAASIFLMGARVIFSEHSSNSVLTTRRSKRFALRVAKRLVSLPIDRFVAPSNYIRARLVDEGVEHAKIDTVWNGVNLERFRLPVSAAEVRRSYGLSPDAMLVASSALLIPEKGIGDLVEAARTVVDARPDVQFVHIGDGPCLEQYRARVAELGLERSFHFVGLLNLPEIAPLIASADVFTLPCTWGEAFSLVVLEAMAAAKPVIATRLGGNMEAVEDGRSGLLVPPFDPAALAAAIIALHDDPAMRHRLAEESGRRSAQFSVGRWVHDTVALYERIAHRQLAAEAVPAPPSEGEVGVREVSRW